MKPILSKPYKLYNKIQNYEWGTKNENAFIPRLLNIDAENNLPYAELWIGAHPKAPSQIEVDGEFISLDAAVQKYPDEILGKETIDNFGVQFPFLLKILSAAQALSIQLHPNKKQAETLHKKDPLNYPDDNHKPEIAIAIDELTAIAGFQPANQIKENFLKYKELKIILGEEIFNSVIDETSEVKLCEKIKIAYTVMMQKSAEQNELDNVISSLSKRFTNSQKNNLVEEQFLTQQNLYGNDVGILSFFFFNMLQLKPGQAIFTDAGIPHAYIKGNIVECMANSDNVVRAGLTPKFKDVATLLDIMDFEFSDFKLMNSEMDDDEVVYQTSAKEFEVSVFTKPAGNEHPVITRKKPIVILIQEGELTVEWKIGDEIQQLSFSKGESFLCPALLSNFILSSKRNSKYYVVSIPE